MGLAALGVVITSATLVVGATVVLGILGSAGLNLADAEFGWTVKLQEEVNETQAWLEHEYKLFRRSMTLFLDLVSGEAKPLSAYNNYLE